MTKTYRLANSEIICGNKLSELRNCSTEYRTEGMLTWFEARGRTLLTNLPFNTTINDPTDLLVQDCTNYFLTPIANMAET